MKNISMFIYANATGDALYEVTQLQTVILISFQQSQ